jgi:SAM-dependent methyltransferase
MKPAFDEYGESYDEVMKKSIGFMGRNHDYYTQAKATCILDVLRRKFGDTKKLQVLDVGCGVGKTDGFLFFDFGKLSGVDVSSASIERAQRENPMVHYEVYDGQALPFADETFDAAFLICVLHHVVPIERAALLKEVRRILKPGGVLLIFEHNPFNPLTQLAVARCEFDRDAQLLSMRVAANTVREAGFSLLDSQYILYFPFKSGVLRGTDFLRRNIPLGAQYFVAGVNHAE